jgi:hypothetical protein
LLTDRSDSTHVSPGDPEDHITCKLWDKDGNTMPTAHYPVKKTDEKPKADEKPKDEGKK